MSSYTKVRRAGALLILGGILFVVHYGTHPLGETSQYVASSLWTASHVIGYVAWISSLFGLIGFYARLGDKSGPLGLVGLVMTIVGGTTLFSAVFWLGAVIQPFLLSNSPALNDSLVSYSSSPALYPLVIGIILFAIGYPIFSIAAYRSKTMQQWTVWAAVLSIIALPLTFGAAAAYLLSNIGGIIWGLSLATWGYALWSKKGASQ